MKGIQCICAALLLWSCTPQTGTEGGPDYNGLVGRWKTETDTSLEIVFTRICCGSKPKIEGSLRWGGVSAALDPLSYAQMYPIDKPDSVSPREYAFEIVLAIRLNPVCAIDGFVQNAAGERGFSRPAIPDNPALSLTFSGMTASDCDSSWKPMTFEPEP